MAKFLASIVLILFVLSCTNNGKQKNIASSKDSISAVNSNKAADSTANDNYFKIGKDSVMIPPFEIEVSLSPKAENRITKGKETIIVAVYFTGEPKDTSQANLQEDGSFFVATATKEIHYGQTAKFDSIQFSKKIYDELADKNIDVDVNVYSGRRSSRDNLLNCEPLFDKIRNVMNKKFILKGKLIYGDK